jgi:hypothetical protein
MTTRRQMAEMAAMQKRVITALRASGEAHVASRLERCVVARLGPRQYDGRPWTCRSPGCRWCRVTLGRRWWLGIQRWITEHSEPVSLAVLPLQQCPGGLRVAGARTRRSLRDVRDRTARFQGRWRGVAMGGMATGRGAALVFVRHAEIDRVEVADVLRRRWPDVTVGDIGSASPCWSFEVEDAVDLARARRGVEPLRAIILPQRVPQRYGGQPVAVEPMPVVL